jgi:hypothetical protein
MVVIHVTDNTASDESEAHYAEHRSDEVSAHFYNDGDSVIQALDTDVIAYGCFSEGNSRSVQFELVGLDWDHDPPGPGAASDATMLRIAPIVARVCRQYGIPIRKVSPAELHAGVAGICGHADVTLAWGQGDHMDPGGVRHQRDQRLDPRRRPSPCRCPRLARARGRGVALPGRRRRGDGALRLLPVWSRFLSARWRCRVAPRRC